MQYLARYWRGSGEPIGATKDHGFTFPFEELAMAAEMVIDSEFRHLPTRDEVRRVDKEWIKQVSELASMIMAAKPVESTDGQ